MKKSFSRFFEYFLIGVLGLLPIVIIFQIVFYIQGLLTSTVMSLYGRYESLLWPVLLFPTAVALVAYIGYLVKEDKAYVLYFVDRVIHRIPLLGTIYRVSQKILKLFHDDSEHQIRDVVLIEYPKDGLWVPAYVTNRVDRMIVVFVPTSPNPTSGFTIIVDEAKAIPCGLTIEEASSFIISLGADLAHAGEIRALLAGAGKIGSSGS